MKNIPGTNYISYRKEYDLYCVVKSIKGKTKHLASFKTLIGALMMRDWCQANDWQPYPKTSRSSTGEKYIGYRENLGVYEIVKNINGSNEYFGRYHSLQEAVHWRDYFMEHDWDTDLRLIGTPNKNIYFKLGKYRITKRINGKDLSFGSFNTLAEAEERLKEIRLKGWENVIRDNERFLKTTVSNIIQLPNGKYEIIKNIDGVKETFGVYNTLEDAEAEVQLLRRCNWDYDAVCESIDETDDGLIFVEADKKLDMSFQKLKRRNDGYLFNKYINVIDNDWFNI